MKKLWLYILVFLLIGLKGQAQKRATGCLIDSTRVIRSGTPVMRITDSLTGKKHQDYCYQYFSMLNPYSDSVSFTCTGKVKKPKLTVYSRSGELVFESDENNKYWNYNLVSDEDPTKYVLPKGDYFYLITWKKWRKKRSTTGRITLLHPVIE